VDQARHSIRRKSAARFLAGLALAGALAALSVVGRAQAPNPSSASNPFYGSVTAHPATDEVLRLSLDEAIAQGLRYNLGLREAENNELVIQGQKKEALQNFLPTITLQGDLGVHQQNLAAMGFGPKTIKLFSSLFPGGMPSGFSEITRDDVTDGQIRYRQMLFSGPVIAGWHAAGAAERAAHFQKMSARGEVVQQVATAYLHAIAAAREVDNAKALEAADQLSLNQAHAAH
jgi:outer membrane protein TolC